MTKFKHLQEMAFDIRERFGGAPVVDVVNGSVVFRDSVVSLQLNAKRQAGCLWVVDTPSGYHTFRRTDEVMKELASIYSYSLV